MIRRLHNGIRNLSLVSLLVSLTLFLSACGAFKKDGSATSGAATCANVAEAQAARSYYTQNIYPLVKMTGACVDCHGPGRVLDNSLISNDVNTAYGATLSRLSPLSPVENSVFWVRATQGHCASCGSVPGYSAINSAIQTWAQRESTALDAVQRCVIERNAGGNGSGGNSTDPSPSPSPSVNAKPYKTIGSLSLDTLFNGVAETDTTTVRVATFNLSAYGGTAAANVTLSFSIRRFSVAEGATPGSFIVFSPKVTIPAGGKAILLSDMELSIEAGSDKYVSDFWSRTSAQVPANANALTISTKSDVMVRPNNSGNNLKLRILTLQEATGGCRNLATFQNTVIPVATTRCVSCHAPNGNNTTARARWTMTTVNASELCDNFKTRILASNPTAPAQSLVIVFPSTGAYNGRTGHPALGTGGFPQADRNAVVNWFLAE